MRGSERLKVFCIDSVGVARMMEQSWEMISDHFGGGTGDTMDFAKKPKIVNPY